MPNSAATRELPDRTGATHGYRIAQFAVMGIGFAAMTVLAVPALPSSRMSLSTSCGDAVSASTPVILRAWPRIEAKRNYDHLS